MIQQRVIQAFKEERTRSKLPGYVPSYSDFEPEEVRPSARSNAVAPTQFQRAEKPHGPHKPASRQSPAGRSRNGFGSGIFE